MVAVDYFDELKKELHYLPVESIRTIEKGYHLAERAHRSQTRQSGEPYISHPVAVTAILARMRLDEASLIAALLHDTVEDTDVSIEDVKAEFGNTVAELVAGVTKLAQIKFESREEAQAENFRKMMLAIAKDMRIIIIKLCDRLHNMQTVGVMRPEKRRRIANETLEIYAPLASRLGMYNLSTELEDLCFLACYPVRYRVLKKALKNIAGQYDALAKNIAMNIEETLKQSNFHNFTVESRKKSLYSTYKKMSQKHGSLSKIMDVLGFRVITDEVGDCYRILGIIHQLYKPIPGRFKDYVAIPKANGYQSLHTNLFGPKGHAIEVQIRSREMHQLATAGIAAHWLYKSSDIFSKAQTRAHKWLQGLVDIKENSDDPIDFIENVKIDLFRDEIYVFTEGGDILQLPGHATPIDFAYAIHSDIGNTTVAVKIDGRLQPLNSRLKNGQKIEIITAAHAKPSSAWLKFVATGKARSNIRQSLSSRKRSESITFGQHILENSLTNLSMSWQDITLEKVNQVLQNHGYKKLDELYEAIGLGNQLVPKIANELAGNPQLQPIKSNKPLPIKGSTGLVLKFAKCCYPLPGDSIVGLFRPKEGMVVHWADCEATANQPDCIELSWRDANEDYEAKGNQPESIELGAQTTAKAKGTTTNTYVTEIHINVQNEIGLLSRLSAIVSGHQADIENIRVLSPISTKNKSNDGTVGLIFLLQVTDTDHLKTIISSIKSDRRVISINLARDKIRE